MTESKTANRTIQARLFQSFEKYPDNIAIRCEGYRVTYNQLARQSNFIANWLIAQGIEKESFIGIMVDDKISLVTIILGIIKAGCVFVPLDSNYPDKRTRAMLLSSETPYVFAEEDKIEKLKTLRRHLPFHLDIITINKGFYLPGLTLTLRRHEDKYKLSEAEKTRYKRQMLLDGWGIEGQERLKGCIVFAAGAGGSGSPLIQQLALCGFGTIIICDFDEVELSNLNRQSLHDESRIGMNKALSAKMTVERMNPHIKVIARPEKITQENVFELVGDAEIIFDNVDSLEAKSYLSECAVARGIPHIISSMIHINSYVCIFHTPYTPCFHCLYDKNKIEDIRRAGTLKQHYEITPNSVASPSLYQATGFAVNEAVKILLGIGKPAYNIYFHFNQYGSAHVAETAGYKQITYPFNDHFRALSRDQGFDWETGWHESYVEEIAIKPDSYCPVCSHTRGLGAQGSETRQNRSKIHDEEPLDRCFYDTPPQINYLPGDKINIYFTSGTTGQPKAVLGKNEGMTHFIAWEINEFKIHEGTRVSQMTSQCHDPFLRDIFVPLCAGGTICVPDTRETLLDNRRMKEWLETSRVNVVHCTPGLFKIMNADGLRPDHYEHLEYVLMAGEKVMPRDLENWYRIFGSRVQLVNVYGPTETTLAKLFYRITPRDVSRESIPIGSPIPGAKVIILNKDMKVCGPGEVGEIYIRTPFRSYGYYKDPGLTAEKFIRNPFTGSPEDIIYKTGDLGKINRDGYVEFVGREDRQVKIRGFRVELDEIEKRLRDYPGVEEAVVLYRPTSTGNYILCAYFKGEGEVSVPGLKEYLKQELPDYMVPAFYIKIERFPLNANGKINTRALPEPDEVERSSYIAPKSELERRMVRIWTEILGIEKIGIHDGFLDMGGNSLNAMNLTSRIYKEYDVNLPLSVIFENPTIVELVSIIEASTASIYQSIEPVEEREYYPLSSAQMRMFLLREFAGEDDISYNQAKPLLLKGKIDKERLEKAFKHLIARHDALRTGFEMIDGQPVQRIHPEVEFKIQYNNNHENQEQSKIFVDDSRNRGGFFKKSPWPPEAIIKNFIRPFNLSGAPLLRVGLVKISGNEHLLIFDIHHIISDGVTTGIFIHEMMKLYHNEPLPVLTVQYKDYAVWQQGMLQAKPLKKQENYWLEVFKEEPPVLNLSTDYPRPAVQSFAGSHWNFDVSPQLVRQLEILAREHHATLYMVLLAAYNTLLYRYTGQEDIVVGSPIAGRPSPDLQQIPGVFINTLAMRNHPTGSKTFAQLLAEIAENAFKAYENQDYPFEELVGKLEPGRHLDRNPLFDTLFVMQNIEMEPIVLEGLEVRPYSLDIPTSKFDISLNTMETSQGFLFQIEYCTRLFRQETIERFSHHLLTLLEAAAVHPGQALNQVEILSPREKEQLIHDFNDTYADYPEDKTINELFAEQVKKSPDSLAVFGMVRGAEQYGVGTRFIAADSRKCSVNVTYRELNEKSDQLSQILIAKGVKTGDIVALPVNRSIQMIIGIMGILKAGGAYLPIDPGFPEERIDYMLADSNVGVLVTTPKLQVKVKAEVKGKFIETSTSTCQVSPANLAYVIYTSGSTGKPKGVAIEHKNVMNFITAMKAEIEFLPGKTILALTTISFDIFLLETLLPLTCGLKVVIASEHHQKDPQLLTELIMDNKIDILQVTPSRLKLFLQDSGNLECLKGLTELIIGGEELPGDLYGKLKEKNPGQSTKIYNVYGPTETTVWSCLKYLNRDREITIGKPIKNTSIYIVDKDENLLPVGAAGELCIGGAGVGQGYLNRPELTAERFCLRRPGGALFEKTAPPGPATLPKTLSLKGTRGLAPLLYAPLLYHTGDLARWLPNGEIEFLGRIDHQVKIRGFRIEIGEIETRLLNHKEIKEAVVIAGEKKGDKYLCAYIVPCNAEAFKKTSSISAELREFLSASLPDYMIPSYFMTLKAIPLTFNGKVDRKALPGPEARETGAYTAPRHRIEKKLSGIWAEILEIHGDISIDANFFHLGGHSLKAALLLAKIHETFHAAIPMTDLFKKPTIRDLSEYITKAEEETYIPITPAEEKEYYPLSFHQKRLWIIQHLEEKNVSYNMPVQLEINHVLDEKAVRKSLKKLIQRHQGMRTRFKTIDGIAFQFIEPDAAPPFKVIDISSLESLEKEQEKERIFKETAGTSFDLSQVPLFRAAAIKSDNRQYDLVFIMHHIICDGWSMGLLEREFTQLYEGYRAGKEMSLPPLPLQYKDFSQWHNHQLHDPRLKEASHRFWREKLASGFPRLQLPTDFYGDRTDSTGAAYRCRVEKQVKERLNRLARTNTTTFAVVMFSIYNILLAHISGQEDIVCSLIGAGRDHRLLQHIVGYFTNSIILKTRIHPEEDFENLVCQVHDNVMETLQHQSYPLEMVLDELNMSFPDIAASFNMLNMPGTTASSDIEAFAPHHIRKRQGVKFDLALYVTEHANSIELLWNYRTTLFEASTIESIAHLYLELLDELSEEEDE
ncbi:MAG: amino acid adenylation domain-containing protein [Candidatus Aminicenantes bacterium]|nr:MAG: amino acid adenylation domain-containing protein [Candidatus Aminicenantes bacterium]